MDADFLAELTEACEPIFVRQVEWEPVGERTTKPRKLYSKCFEDWYAAYPKKCGKEKANAAYIRAGKRIVIEKECDKPTAVALLLAAAKEYAASPKGKGNIAHIHNPTTWLNGGHWDDDRSVWNHIEELRPSPATKAAGESGTEKARRLFGEEQ